MRELTAYTHLRRKVEGVLLGGQKQIESLKVEIYWRTGRLIARYLEIHPEENGRGKNVMARLASDLEMEASLFYRMHQFARAFPNFVPGRNLTWTHYRALLALPDASRRRELAKEAEAAAWPVRRLRRELVRHNPPKQAKVESSAPLVEPVRPAHGVSHIGWLAGLGGKKRKVVDLGFDIYRELTAAEAVKFRLGDLAVWSHEIQKWVLSQEKEGLYFYSGAVERVVDGDTLLVHVDLGFGLKRRQYLRLRGINAAELSRPEGTKARDFLLRAVEKAPSVQFKSRFTDRWDRYLSDVWAGELYLNRALLDAGLAERVDY
ncbi:MAG TPA: DUF1016 N-terminal domain-containing protein [bacterium]|nr:DUF1016 N-terminal domain-containing protein [bacterium]